jgi:hypothetical protein
MHPGNVLVFLGETSGSNPVVQVEVLCRLFGSVPLKTYLPDGDIDIGIFQFSGAPVQDRWIRLVKSAFEAQIRVQPPYVVSVELIQAEVMTYSHTQVAPNMTFVEVYPQSPLGLRQVLFCR